MAEKQLKTLTPAQYAFIKWLSDTHPNLVAAAEERRASLNGFMDSLTNTFNNVIAKAPELLNQYVTGKAQVEQLKINIARAKEGQPPITNIPIAQAHSAASAVPGWVWAAGGAILVYLVVRK